MKGEHVEEHKAGILAKIFDYSYNFQIFIWTFVFVKFVIQIYSDIRSFEAGILT